MIPSEFPSDWERRLDEAFAEYLHRRDSGEPVDLAKFLEEHADCAEALRECIEAENCVRAMAKLPPSGTTQIDSSPNDPDMTEKTKLASSPLPGGGRMLGDYELLHPIGRGGMGIIYKARQRSLDRTVAVKVIREVEFATSTAIQRFRSEAQLAARLQHPHIVSIHEIGEQQGLAYFSMDLIPGQSLAETLHAGPLSPRRAAKIIVRVSEAMEYAHQQGLLHRDLKPSNILLDQHNQPLVTDFGLARTIEGDSDLTKTGEIVGTVSYMSPEQADPVPSNSLLGPASDVYSLGALLYALLIGRPPFQAESPLDTLLQVREQEPISPRSLNPKIPRDLETICLKCLEKSPRQRYPRAGGLAEDLNRFLEGQPILAKRASRLHRTWRWCGRHPGTALALIVTCLSLLLIMGGVTVYGIHVNRLNSDLAASNKDLLQTRSDLLESQAELTTSLDETQTARDQAEQSEQRLQRLLYAANMRAAGRALQESDFREMNRLLERQRPRTGVPDLRGPEWHLLRRLASPPHVELKGHLDDVRVVKYSMDGRWLASAGDDASVRVYHADTLELHSVFRIGIPAVRGLAFNPAGDRLACCCEDGQVRLFHLPSGKHVLTIPAHPELACDAVWSRDGRLLITAGNDDWVRLWEAQTGQAVGRIGPHNTGKWVIRIALSPEERFLATVSNSVCSVWDMKTKKQRFRFQDTTRITSAAFSPDGRWLSFGSLNGRAFLVPCPDFPSPPPFSSIHDDAVESVAFSADGQWGADADRGGVLSLWPLHRDSEGRSHVVEEPEMGTETDSRRVLAHRDRIVSLAFSPDGRRIASTGWDRIVKVWELKDLHQPKSPRSLSDLVTDVQYLAEGTILACTGGGVMEWTPQTGTQKEVISKERWNAIAVSPDQHTFAVGSSDGQIFVWDRRGEEETGRFRDSNLGIVWSLIYSPDGSRLFARTVGGLIILNPKTLQRLDLVPPLRCNAMALSSDGRLLALSPKGPDNIEIWDLETRKRIRTIEGHSSEVKSLDFSPDDEWIVSGSEDRLIKLWRVADGKLKFTFSGHRGRVIDVAFSPDGKTLWSTGWDTTLRIWSATLGQELVTLGDPEDPIRSVFHIFYHITISPEGRSLVHTVKGKPRFYQMAAEGLSNRREQTTEN